uniref:Uncharacterized protein n=1 Tax=mine drainage metagenome TaxID=410659 RepID=E6QPH0_9ZZZZ
MIVPRVTYFWKIPRNPQRTL